MREKADEPRWEIVMPRTSREVVLGHVKFAVRLQVRMHRSARLTAPTERAVALGKRQLPQRLERPTTHMKRTHVCTCAYFPGVPGLLLTGASSPRIESLCARNPTNAHAAQTDPVSRRRWFRCTSPQAGASLSTARRDSVHVCSRRTSCGITMMTSAGETRALSTVEKK